MMKTTLKAKWTYNGALHKATIGNGLLTLLVIPKNLADHDGNWQAQINGNIPIKTPDVFTSVDDAKGFVEARAVLYLRSMLSELA